jgi:hypothetical protein
MLNVYMSFQNKSKMQSLRKHFTKLVSSKLNLLVVLAFSRFVSMYSVFHD